MLVCQNVTSCETSEPSGHLLTYSKQQKQIVSDSKTGGRVSANMIRKCRMKEWSLTQLYTRCFTFQVTPHFAKIYSQCEILPHYHTTSYDTISEHLISDEI